MADDKDKDKKRKRKLDKGTRTIVFLAVMALSLWTLKGGPNLLIIPVMAGWIYILFPYWKD